MFKFSQHSFGGGQIDRDLMGRQDLAKYFVGATTLENFLVKRQGCISKRRGTELVADLDNIFGNGNAIEHIRAIPFVYARDGGFSLLFASPSATETTVADNEEDPGEAPVATKVFICSWQGIWGDLETTTEVDDGEGNITTTSSTEKVWSRSAYAPGFTPYAIDVPYTGVDLDGIGYTQSGDTLYLAHMGYPFAKMVHNSDGTFTYSVIDFSALGGATQYYPPTIVWAKAGGEGGGASREISYVATYVKDGIESGPSVPVYISYQLPWASTFRISLTLGKGANEEEPDYYNVYKKSGGEYGFIGRTGRNDADVVLASTSTTGTAIYYIARWPYGGQHIAEGYSTQYNNNDTSIFSKYGLNYGTYNYQSPYSGYYHVMVDHTHKALRATSATDGLTISIKDGHCATKFRIDCTCIGWPSQWNHRPYGGSFGSFNYVTFLQADYLELTATYTNGTTTRTYKQRQQIQRRNDVFVTVAYFDLNQNQEITKTPQQVLAEIGDQPAYFSFQEYVDADFPNGGVYLRSLNFTAYDDGETTTPSTALAQVSRIITTFTDVNGNVVDDDYITPDISLTPPSREEHFNTSENYPSAVALYQQRLVLAATDAHPFTFWMSCVGDLYNFNTHATIREDDAIDATIPATEFPDINHVVMNKDLILFCDNGEWVVSPTTGNAVSYKTIQVKQQSQIGCAKRLPPIVIADEIIFAENTAETLRAIRYDFTADGYQSTDLSVLSQNLFRGNPIVDMAYKQHPDSIIVCVLEDGTLATLVYMKEHEMAAWSHTTLGGGYKARGVCTDKAIAQGTTDIYLLAERENENGRPSYVFLRVREDDPTQTVQASLSLDAIRWVTADENTAIPDGAIAVDLLTGEAVETLEVGRDYGIGYPFEAIFRSIQPEAQGQATIQLELKGAKNVELRLMNASTCEVVPTQLETATHNQWRTLREPVTVDPETGAVTQRDVTRIIDTAMNSSIDGRITLASRTHWPLALLSYSVNYELDPRLINQQG